MASAFFEHVEEVFFADVADDAEAEAHGIIGFDGAAPVGAGDADRADFEAVAFGVFDDGGGGIETHRLVVQKAGVKFGRVMGFQVGAAISEDGKK